MQEGDVGNDLGIVDGGLEGEHGASEIDPAASLSRPRTNFGRETKRRS